MWGGSGGSGGSGGDTTLQRGECIDARCALLGLASRRGHRRGLHPGTRILPARRPEAALRGPYDRLRDGAQSVPRAGTKAPIDRRRSASPPKRSLVRPVIPSAPLRDLGSRRSPSSSRAGAGPAAASIFDRAARRCARSVESSGFCRTLPRRRASSAPGLSRPAARGSGRVAPSSAMTRSMALSAAACCCQSEAAAAASMHAGGSRRCARSP